MHIPILTCSEIQVKSIEPNQTPDNPLGSGLTDCMKERARQESSHHSFKRNHDHEESAIKSRFDKFVTMYVCVCTYVDVYFYV